MARPKIPDMPVALIALDPRVAYMPAAAYGMLRRLLDYHWITGKPIPSTDAGVQAIIVAHQPSWKAHKAEIRAVIADLAPALERAKQKRIEIRARLQLAADLSKASRRNARVERHKREAAEKSARTIAIPERTQTQTRINVENRTKRQAQSGFVETHF